MKHLVSLWLFAVISILGMVVSAQPLLEVDADKVDLAILRSLYAGQQARRKTNLFTVNHATVAAEERKLIVVNPETLDNAALSLTDNIDGPIKVTPLLIAELKNAGLDHAETYDCIVADVSASGEYTCREMFNVNVQNEIRLPKFRYGRKGSVRLAGDGERKIKAVSLSVPMPILDSEATEEDARRAFEKNRQMALDNCWYTYEYVLPNGDLTTYVDFGEDVSELNPIGTDSAGEENAQTTGISIDFVTGTIGSHSVQPGSSEAQACIRAGAQTWCDLLSITVPVIAKVGFASDYGSGSSTLGSSFSPPTYTHDGYAYPAALIDQILGADMHPSTAYDIRIVYNKDFTFY